MFRFFVRVVAAVDDDGFEDDSFEDDDVDWDESGWAHFRTINPFTSLTKSSSLQMYR